MTRGGASGSGGGRLGADQYQVLLEHLDEHSRQSFVAFEGSARRITYVTPEVCTQFNCRPADVVGHPLQSLSTRLDDLARDPVEGPGNGRVSLPWDNAARYEEVQAHLTWLGAADNPLGVITLFGLEPASVPVAEAGSAVDAGRAISVSPPEGAELLGQLARSLNGVLWVTDIRVPKVLYVSPQFERIYGYPAEALRRDATLWLQAILAEDRERAEAAFRAQARGESTDVEYRIQRPDGSVRWISDRASPIADETGAVARIAGVAKDITDRKGVEHALAAEKSFVDQTLNSLPGVFYLFDAGGRMIRWNNRFEEISGYATGEIAAMHPLDFIAPEDRDRVDAKIREALGDDHVRVEARLLTRQGQCIPYLFTGERTELHGDPYVVGLGVDISERVDAERRLKQSEARYRSFVENTTEGIYSFVPPEPIPTGLPEDEQIRLIYAGHFEMCNGAFARMYGLADTRDAVGLTLEAVHGGDDAPENIEFLRQWVRAGYRISGGESKEVDQAGDTVWFSNSVVGVVEDGKLVHVWGSQTDITARKEAEEALRLSASVFENTDEGVVIAQPDLTIIDVNPALCEMTGYAREELIGATLRLFQSGAEDPSRDRALWRALETVGHWQGELWNRRKDGDVLPQWLTISSVRDGFGRLTHYVGVSTDISQLKHSEAQLDHLAHHDPLTDLPNRLLLNERLEHAIRQVERRDSGLAVVFLDIDNFKHLNDSLGHPVGDKLLCRVAEALTEAMRAADTVARISGDEFVLVLEDIESPDDAAATAEKLMSIFGHPFLVDDREVRVTASAGVSLCPRDGDDAATLLRNADAAMYLAKDTGRNSYHFYTEALTHRAYARMLMVNDLYKAWETGEFFLVYQPQIRFDGGSSVGLETLLRWRHPERGLVSPAEFIPLAEDSGLIHQLGAWVLRGACEQAKRWLDAGLSFGRVAVNVSGLQMQRGNLPETVFSALEKTGLPPECLELEITESFIMQHTEHAVGQLDQLRSRGVTLAIDDFGTGYSSLSYLKALPLQKIKLDKSFVRDVPDDPNDMAICAAVIAIGRSLGLTVIAEGVETQEQASYLISQGCDEAQGFLFSKPLPVEDVHSFVTAGRPELGRDPG